MKITAQEEYGLRCLLRLARGGRAAAAHHSGDRGRRGAVAALRRQAVGGAAAGRSDRERPRPHRRLSAGPPTGRHSPRLGAAGARRTAVRRADYCDTPRRPETPTAPASTTATARSASCGRRSKTGCAAPSTRSPSPTCCRARAASPTCCASACGRGLRAGGDADYADLPAGRNVGRFAACLFRRQLTTAHG